MTDHAPLGQPVAAIRAGRRATIYDIARVTGLSPSTISRGLSKPGRLNAETEKRIKEAADLLGYEANPLARALPTGRTGNLGLVVPVIDHPVFTGLVRGVERAAAAVGYTVMISETGDRADLGEEAARKLSPLVDGLVLISPRQDESSLQRLGTQKPLILVNRHVAGVASVAPELTAGYRDAVRYLVEHGHRSVAYLPAPGGSWASRQRGETLAREAAEAGLSYVQAEPGDVRTAGGVDNLEIARSTGAGAVFTYNDLMAVGILHAAHAGRVRVPDEFSLIGYDDIFGADFVIPTLSTIRPPLAEMGEAAVRSIMERLGEGKTSVEDLDTKFIRRNSSGPARV